MTSKPWHYGQSQLLLPDRAGGETTVQNDFSYGTKLPMSLKTKGRGETDWGTKLPFRLRRTEWNLGA
jgi:hypothetical protein